MSKKRVLIAINRHWYPSLLSKLDLDRLHELADVVNGDIPAVADKKFLLDNIQEADMILTSWDTAQLDEEVLSSAKRLKLLCHAAGSVRPVVSDTLWQRGIKVTSAAAAISHGVAEFCLGLILMASKRVFWLNQGTHQGYWMEPASCFGGLFELYQQNVGVIGAGHIGRRLIRLLQNFDCRVHAYDPFLSFDQAKELGCEKLDTLEELFATCRVVSLNAPTNEGTRNMLRGHHFAALQPGSVFVNTAGSIQINEPEFVDQLRRGNFVACIDRCEIEPCALDHPYRNLPNVILTPHIAGTTAENRLRIGTFAINEVEAYLLDKPLIHEVTKATLAAMA